MNDEKRLDDEALEKVSGGTGNDEDDFLYDFMMNNCQHCSKALNAAYYKTATYCDPMSKYDAVHGDGNARCPDIC